MEQSMEQSMDHNMDHNIESPPEESTYEKPKKGPVNIAAVLSNEAAERNQEISNLASESDRHRNVPQPARIRKNELSYEESPDLFQGEPVDHRRQPRNAVKKYPPKPAQTESKTAAMVKTIMKERQMLDEQHQPQTRAYERRA
jgi:DNA-binding protein H-NS